MKPSIVSISGCVLSPEERSLFADLRPAGVILFARNVVDPSQLNALIAELRAVLPEQACIMVDQEGGRVARLRRPHWRAHPPARALQSEHAAWLSGALIGAECAAAGFDVVAAPVLDVASLDGHDVIGDRSFSADPERVAVLGGAFLAGLLAAGVQGVCKHAPGHGRARADSHLELPSLDDVSASDILPFARNRGAPWMMTAHIRYMQRDSENPATQSAAIIGGVVRAEAAIGFDGVLVTDDLAMGALSGTPGERSVRALAAGCDIALHCSGVLEETRDVLESVPAMTPDCLVRLMRAREMARAAKQVLNMDELEAARAELVGRPC